MQGGGEPSTESLASAKCSSFMRSTAARSRLDDHGSSPIGVVPGERLGEASGAVGSHEVQKKRKSAPHSSSISMYRSDHRSSARPKSWFWCERMEAYLHVPRNSAEARACSRRGAVSSRRGQQARLAGRVAGTGCATPSLLRHRRASPKSRMWQRHLFTAGGVKAAAVHTPRAAASEEAGHMAAPRPTQKLDGLMSRCTQPISCIVRMASTICTPALATVRSESRRRGADFRS